MVTHGLTSVRGYFRDLLRYSNQDTAAAITCPSLAPIIFWTAAFDWLDHLLT